MSWKQFVAGYLTFPRRDRMGVVVLLLLILVAALLPFWTPEATEKPVPVDRFTRSAADSLQKTDGQHRQSVQDYRDYAFEKTADAPIFSNAALFTFDPNTLDAEGWRRLGLREKTIRTLHNYRSKGGRFYKPEDLAKIWGLPPGFYERVKGHIRIVPPENRFAEKTITASPATYVKPAPRQIDINNADTSELIALPGIGSRLAARIVHFRNKLGGFSSVAQLGETYGLPDSTFQRIKDRLVVEPSGVQRMNINTASKEQLSAHPYINWKLANAIVAYREQHGPFGAIEEVKKIMILDETTFTKVQPYLSIQ